MIITIARKPLSEGTVASNVLEHGCGGFNIDATRIPAHARPLREIDPKPTASSVYAGRMKAGTGFDGGSKAVGETNQGRWPANLILQHLEGCRCDGTKKIKSGNHKYTNPVRQTVRRVYSDFATDYERPTNIDISYADVDGTETIPNWLCEPGCPVRALDLQSGSTKGVVRHPTGNPVYPTGGSSMKWNPNDVRDTTVRGFDDEGGASRFFKQVTP